jgi:succinate dehydrogenase / fumarate reductase iron-sulfur subunit
MEAAGHRPVLPLADEPAPTSAMPPRPEDLETIRLADCIECGLCISACPVATTTPAYLGPAVLAGAQQHGLDGNRSLLALVDCKDGLWRCHSAFECSAVCPSNVDPARRIMDLRRQVLRARILKFFGRG